MLYPSYYLFESSLPHRFTNNTTSSCISFYLLMHGWMFTSPVFVQSLSHVWLFLTPWTAALQAPLSSRSLLKFMSIKSVMLSNHLIFCHPLLLLSSIFPATESFSVNQHSASGGQSIGASASVLPMNIQGWFSLGQTLAAPSHGPANPSSRPSALQSVSKHSLNLCLFSSGLKFQERTCIWLPPGPHFTFYMQGKAYLPPGPTQKEDI